METQDPTLVCAECGTFRLDERPEGTPETIRVIGRNIVHHAGTHELYADLSAYRRVTGPGSHDPLTDDTKNPADAGLVEHQGVWSVSR